MPYSELCVAEKKVKGVSAGFVVGYCGGSLNIRKDLVFKTEDEARAVFDRIEENSKAESNAPSFEIKAHGQKKYYTSSGRYGW